MANYAVQPGARVVWCMKRRTTDVRCILLSSGMPVEVQVVHGRDVVVTEMFQEEWMAMNWARAYQDRLRAQGWNDVPEEVRALARPNRNDGGGGPEQHRDSATPASDLSRAAAPGPHAVGEFEAHQPRFGLPAFDSPVVRFAHCHGCPPV